MVALIKNTRWKPVLILETVALGKWLRYGTVTTYLSRPPLFYNSTYVE